MLLVSGQLAGTSPWGTRLLLAFPGVFVDARLLGRDLKGPQGAARSGPGSAARSGGRAGGRLRRWPRRGWHPPGRWPRSASAGAHRGREGFPARTGLIVLNSDAKRPYILHQQFWVFPAVRSVQVLSHPQERKGGKGRGD